MDEIVTQPLRLNKKSRSSRFARFTGEANRFHDKLLRVLYITLLFLFDFVMFAYSVNGRVFEDGKFNEALGAVICGIFAVAFVLIFALSFSKDLQNGVCGIFTMLVTVIFFKQFALFNPDTFIETWLSKKASWLTFIGIIPSSWLIGLLLGVAVFFAFRNTFAMLFIVVVFLFSGLIGVKKNEFLVLPKDEYQTVKEMGGGSGQKREDSIVYLMVPKFPSYQFLSSVRDGNFKELRDLMVGFYAVNGFEVYPNAFVQKNDTMSNIIDILNQVDYTSTTSGNRGFAEFVNDWDFIHGGLDYFSLEDNRLYDYLKGSGYGISSYPMPGLNFCLRGGELFTDRCVVKSYRRVSLYDKNSSLEKNIYAFLGEWLLSLKDRNLTSVAKMLLDMSHLKGMKVTSENRRVSIEGSSHLLNKAGGDFVKDSGGQVYMIFVDLPSDIFIYDQYCNVKPRNKWVAIKDNSLSRGGIDEKRQAYADQMKCLIGKMQEYMEDISKHERFAKTDVIVQGVSTIRELSGVTAGRYSTFVAEKLVSLGIRKSKRPKFLINANVCLASDFTKTFIRYQDYCYSIDNIQNMSTEDVLNLKQNLINNSIIRGSKISNIAMNFKDWYEEFKLNSHDYLKKAEKEKQREEAKRKQEEALRAEKEKQNDVRPEPGTYNRAARMKENIFAPSEDLILEFDEDGEMVPVGNWENGQNGEAEATHKEAEGVSKDGAAESVSAQGAVGAEPKAENELLADGVSETTAAEAVTEPIDSNQPAVLTDGVAPEVLIEEEMPVAKEKAALRQETGEEEADEGYDIDILE